MFLEETVEKLKREKESYAWGSSARRPLGLASLGEDEGEGEPEEDSQTVVEKGSFSVSGGNKTGEFRVPPLALHKYKGSDPFEHTLEGEKENCGSIALLKEPLSEG